MGRGPPPVLRTHEVGWPARRPCRPDRHPRRVGGQPARSRRRGVPGPAGRLRGGPGRRPRRVLESSGAHGLRNEFCLRVTGEVSRRPAGQREPALATGEIEVLADVLEVLSEAAPLPFQIGEHVEVGEEARLKYRYLDLRRPAPAAALRLRSEVNRVAREVLQRHDFVEIETPTLTRSTPEGARDFVVPARLRPGLLVRAAAEPAAVQAAADGGRDGAVLPDRPLLPRRGLPRRPPAGVHPARHRDVVRRAGRRDRARPRRSWSGCGG